MNYHCDPWYQEGIGRLLWMKECEALESTLTKLFGYHYVQLGSPAFVQCAHYTLIQNRIFVTPFDLNVWPCSLLRSDTHTLALRSDSVDVVCLPHVLEWSPAPHQVLREVSRVLIPGGHVVVLGLNPWSALCSCYMGVRLVRTLRKRRTLMSMARVRDWLQLLDFEVLETRRIAYNRFFSIPWPFLGASYMMVAVKRVGALRCVRPQFKKIETVWGAQAPRPT